jgi:TRAP-type uncharacterized transport system substrate-binding protein
MAEVTEGLPRVHAPIIRARFVMEMAAEMVADGYPDFREARVELRGRMPIVLDSSSAVGAVDMVVSGRSALAMTNPSAFLTLAYRGQGPWTKPQPVRALCVLPSRDTCTFAAVASTGLSHFEDIAAKRYPLKIAVREAHDHSLHMVLEHLMAAAGFSKTDLISWGGEFRYETTPRRPKPESLAAGADSFFDEAIRSWLSKSIESGMRILSISEPTMKKLEAMGYRRAFIKKANYPKLPADVIALDFSGWPVFVHANTPDAAVRRMCAGLEARKNVIPWDGDGPLPLERMCRDTPETPLDVPLHPAAEAFWKERGYI